MIKDTSCSDNCFSIENHSPSGIKDCHSLFGHVFTKLMINGFKLSARPVAWGIRAQNIFWENEESVARFFLLGNIHRQGKYLLEKQHFIWTCLFVKENFELSSFAPEDLCWNFAENIKGPLSATYQHNKNLTANFFRIEFISCILLQRLKGINRSW